MVKAMRFVQTHACQGIVVEDILREVPVSRRHLELLQLYPNYFAETNLNLPESDNSIPDIIDEALFNIDCYRRLQTVEGGIRGGIEAAEHPKQGETSWLESLKVMAYAPGPWSSYLYANVAARAGTQKNYPKQTS